MLRLCLLFSILTGGLFNVTELERRAVYPFDTKHVTPARAGLKGVRERQITLGEERLIVWTAAPRKGRPTILYFHGNAGNLANRAWRFEQFLARGYGLVAPAYRGSSGSTGTPSEPALTTDAQTVYDSLKQLLPGVTPARVVIYGESLGTGVALKLAATRPKTPPIAVVLEAPFTSLPDVVRQTMPRFKPLLPVMKNRWTSSRHVRSLKAPLLVLHGTRDRIIPIEQGRQVYAAAPSKTKHFLAVEGAGHADTWRADTLPELWRFIDAQSASIR